MPILRRRSFLQLCPHPLPGISLERPAYRTAGVLLAFLHYSW